MNRHDIRPPKTICLAVTVLLCFIGPAVTGCRGRTGILAISARTPNPRAGAEALGCFLQGISCEQDGDLKAARAEFAKARRLDPASAIIAARLGMVSHRLGLCDEAAPHLAFAEKAAPEDGPLALSLARFYSVIGREADALRMCDAAAANPNSRYEAFRIKAEVLFKQGKVEAAAKNAAVPAKERGDAKDRLLLGHILAEQGEIDRAATAYLKAAPENPQAAVYALHIYACRGNFAQATSIIRRHLRVIPPQANLEDIPFERLRHSRDSKVWEWKPAHTILAFRRHAYVLVAWIAFTRKNSDAAEAALTESIEETGEYFEAYEYLGNINRSGGRKKSAMRHFRKALMLAPPPAARNRIEENIEAVRK